MVKWPTFAAHPKSKVEWDQVVTVCWCKVPPKDKKWLLTPELCRKKTVKETFCKNKTKTMTLSSQIEAMGGIAAK